MSKTIATAPPSIGKTALSIDDVSETYKKVTFRLIPFLFICYVVAYLDRINVGFAQLQMKQDLGFSDAVYGLGAGIFFAGYFLFEVPSNLYLVKTGARKTMTRILICWGFASASLMFVSSPTMFYVIRFLLGVFEAGFFPGVVFYLSCWYPGARRGHVLGLFMMGIPIAGLIGGPVSGWAMNNLAGVMGLHGWQWLFLLEGLPAVLLGFLVHFILDDDFKRAKWLTAREKETISHALAMENNAESSKAQHSFGQALKDPRIYIMAFAYFTFICGLYAISFWLPTILKSAGIKNVLTIGLYAAIPYGISAIGMVMLCRNSDRTLERRWHNALCAFIGALALALIPAAQGSLTLSLLLLSVAATTVFATMPLIWTIPSAYLAGTPAAAGSIAFINSLGLIGGFVSPSIIGWVKTTTGSLTGGLYLIAFLLLAGGVALLIGVPKHLLMERPIDS